MTAGPEIEGQIEAGGVSGVSVLARTVATRAKAATRGISIGQSPLKREAMPSIRMHTGMIVKTAMIAMIKWSIC